MTEILNNHQNPPAFTPQITQVKENIEKLIEESVDLFIWVTKLIERHYNFR